MSAAAAIAPAISVDRVAMRFGEGEEAVLALAPTRLDVSPGEFVVLLGPSGCGKTTLLRIVAGLQRPTTGDVRLFGTGLYGPGGDESEAARRSAVVFQDANLFPWLDVAANIALPLRLRGVGSADRRARAEALMRLVGIEGFGRRWPRELSGGMRQRAAIARALAAEPQILLMDEPFGALDAMTRDALNVEAQRIWMTSGCTVLLVTHSIAEAVFLADRVFLFSPRPGRITAVEEVEFPRPRAMSLQADPAFQAVVTRLRARLADAVPAGSA